VNEYNSANVRVKCPPFSLFLICGAPPQMGPMLLPMSRLLSFETAEAGSGRTRPWLSFLMPPGHAYA